MVSPGEVQRNQYQDLGIPEYWIVDPTKVMVMVLRLTNRLYEETILNGSDRIISPAFPQLILTAAQILNES